MVSPLIWEKHTPKIVILDEWNGYPEMFSFSQALEISRQCFILRTVMLQKKDAGVSCVLVG